ncbi:MAG: AroB-related putative sugar phosphate phospholyase (cyclizing) [Paludibacter sp.]
MQINVESKIKNYSIIVQPNFDFLGELSQSSPRAIVIDKNVWTYYEPIFIKFFKKDEVILFEATEPNKTIDSVLQLCDSVMSSQAKKNMTIISIGGGIVQDVSGFLASILYRGVNWIFVPTTLLAQSDSCMGSKTSLNYKSYKNLLGSFFPPTKIFVNVEFTKTLTEQDFYSGLGEVVKLHLMGGQRNIDIISSKIIELDSKRNDVDFITELVRDSLSIKYSYIKDDEFDTGRRNLLNFGHCFGHALEVSSHYAIPHGTAVVVGMIFANIIASKRGLLSKDNENSYFNNILRYSFKFQFKKDQFNKDTILAALKMDKKRTGEGLPLILIQDNMELTKIIDMTSEELFYGIDKVIDLLMSK